MFLWFHRLSTAKYFFDFASRLFPWLATLAAITIAVGLYLGLLVALLITSKGKAIESCLSMYHRLGCRCSFTYS